MVFVTWSTGEDCSTMHILVIHALIILLTYGPVTGSELYSNLLETWFPSTGELPKAYLLNTSEEALLIPDWLKLRMIRSTVSRLVDAALINLEVPQLVLFIQSFGIPVSSMSKLLCNLDAAVTIDQTSVDEAVLDKCYMAQLVEVQHRRGATGGNTFVQVLQLQEPKLPDEPIIATGTTKLSLPEQTAEKILTAFTQNSLLILLSSLFGNITYEGDINKAFSNLLRKLGQEINSQVTASPLLVQVVEFLKCSVNSNEFIKILTNQERYSCALFRVLLASNKSSEQLVELAKYVLDKIENKRCALAVVLKQLVKKQINNEAVVLVRGAAVSPEEILNSTELVSLERTTKELVEHNLEKTNTGVLVEAMSNLLLKDVGTKKFERTGLFVDWIAELEMEIIGTSPDLQMSLLFSKHPSTSLPLSWMHFRPYLLTLLTHRVSWGTLYICVTRLLSECNTNYDPAAVLDFLWALTCNPKLWQGRDKFTPKNYKPENVLRLQNSQITVLVNYILEEAYQMNGTNERARMDSMHMMESRLPLLLQCLADRNDIAFNVVVHLRSIMLTPKDEEMEIISLDDSFPDDTKKSRSEMAREFLVLLYMKLPRIIHNLSLSDKESICQFSHMTKISTSVVDKISHNLFTALASTPRAKDWSRKSHEFELLARKMAAVHPALVLRQLPMIAAGLKGRTHLDFSFFKSRNHLNLFGQILGVVELLMPYIFEDTYKEGLEGILRAYFSLFKQHGHVKELHTILGKFVCLLQAFMSHDASRALKYLQQYAHLLYDLHLTYSNLRPLRTLMSSISLPKEEGFSENSGETGEVLVAVARPPSPEPVPPNWNNLVANIGKLQDDEMTSVLQEIDHVSNRRPSILEPIADQLAGLILSPCGSVRQLGHVLLLRYLRHNPSTVDSSSLVLSAVLRSLESTNADIVNSVLDRLPDFIVCLQEYAVRILDKAFLIGVKSNINTSTNICKALNVLNIQSGC